MNLKRGMLALLACILLAGGSPALVQDVLLAASCGLPAAGVFAETVTYTLTEDCVQDGQLEVAADAIITINGNGHSISGPVDGSAIFSGLDGSTLHLSQLTVDGLNMERGSLVNTKGTLTATAVTFTRSQGGPALDSESGAQVTLNDVLFLTNTSRGADADGKGSALNVAGGASVSIEDVVFRDNLFGGAAVVIRDGATAFAASGCLSFSGNIPYNVVGSWSPDSSGPCSGQVGNEGQAAAPAPETLACGIPGSGILDESGTYTLKGDCERFGQWLLSDGVEISITGDGHFIRGAIPGINILTAANASLSMENLTLDGIRTVNFGSLNGIDVAMRNAPSQAILNMGEASFTRALFENNVNVEPRYSASVLFAWSEYRSSVASFTDTIFRGNQGGDAALVNFRDGATIHLNGCISFENNAPADKFWIISDSSTGPCGLQFGLPYIAQVVERQELAQAQAGDTFEAFRLIEFPGQSAPAPTAAPTATPAITATPEADDCFQNLGAIGKLCRVAGQSVTTIDVYRVEADSTGTFVLRVTQTEVDNTGNGNQVKSTSDGRVAVFIEDDGNITFAKGPNSEGKVHHVTLQDDLNGTVVSTVDRIGGPPGTVSTSQG